MYNFKEHQAHDLATQFTKEYFNSQNDQFNYRKNEAAKSGTDFKEETIVITTDIWFKTYINFYHDFKSLLEESE